MDSYVLPTGSYFDTEGLLRNREGVLLPDGFYKDGDNGILYEGIFESTMTWDENPPKKINEPILDPETLEMC